MINHYPQQNLKIRVKPAEHHKLLSSWTSALLLHDCNQMSVCWPFERQEAKGIWKEESQECHFNPWNITEDQRVQLCTAFHPKRTWDSYTGYLQQGRTFLKDLVAERQANIDSSDSTLDDDVDINLLEKVFDNPPNKYSVMALELSLVQKCLTEDRGLSTAAGI